MALPILIFEGDSLTALNPNVNITNDGGYAIRLVASSGAGISSSNLAAGGSTVAIMSARSAAVDALYNAARPWQVLFVWIGINDLNAGRTAADVYTDYVAYCQARRAVGFKVVAFTLEPTNQFPATEAKRQTLATSVRAGWTTFADALVDIAADATIGPLAAASDLTLSYDGLHLTGKGQGYVLALAQTALRGIVPTFEQDMALSAALVWECRASGASDNNGGGYKTGGGGTDRSQQNAAQVAIDNSTITTSIAANVITFTGGYSPSAADVGNVVQMLTGTNVTAGFYEITSMVAGTSWTVAGTATLPTSGTTTNATGNMGGALATLSKLSGAMVASNKAYCTGSFSSTATTTFAQTATPTGTVSRTRLIGYGATRGDTTHATLTLSTNTGLTGIALTGNGFFVEQMDVNCASLGTSTGISGSGFWGTVQRCKVSNFTTRAIVFTGTIGWVLECEATGGGSGAIAILTTGQQAVMNCWLHDNAGVGIQLGASSSGSMAMFNLIANNSGATSDGIAVSNTGTWVVNNTIHASGRDGIRSTTTNEAGNIYRDNILTSNVGAGITGNATNAVPAAVQYDGNAFFGNGSTRANMDSVTGIYAVSPYTNVRDVILSGSPYTGPTSGGSENFGLNNTAGAGAACRAAGIPGSFPGLATTIGYLDMGAVQHQDSATSTGSHFVG
jgi:hypothetical protein